MTDDSEPHGNFQMSNRGDLPVLKLFVAAWTAYTIFTGVVLANFLGGDPNYGRMLPFVGDAAAFFVLAGLFVLLAVMGLANVFYSYASSAHEEGGEVASPVVPTMQVASAPVDVLAIAYAGARFVEFLGWEPSDVVVTATTFGLLVFAVFGWRIYKSSSVDGRGAVWRGTAVTLLPWVPVFFSAGVMGSIFLVPAGASLLVFVDLCLAFPRRRTDEVGREG